MARRLKTTLFTRFLIMLLIVAPLAYFGASYVNGEDPIKNLKQFFQKDQTEQKQVIQADSHENGAALEILQEQLKECQQKNEELNQVIGELKAQLKNQ